MRLRRYAWIISIVFCLWALLYYGRAEYFYLLVFLGALFILSAAELALAVFSFRMEWDGIRLFPTKHEKFRRRLTVRSSLFPIMNIRVSFLFGHCSDTQRIKRIFHVSATKSRPAVLSIPLKSEFSGLYELNVSSVEIFDFLGFFRYSVPLRARFPENPLLIPILPKISRCTKAPKAFSELIPPMRKTPERSENAGGREYRPGDDFRTVNWKRTAKTGVLYVKEYEKGSQDFHLIYVDVTRPEVPGNEAIVTTDLLLSQAADLCAYLLREQRPVTILSFSEKQDEQCNLLHTGSLDKARTYLANRRFTENVPEDYKDRLSAFWEIGKNSLSVFSAALTPESLSFLSRFSGDLATVTLFLIVQKGHDEEARSVSDYYTRLGVYCFLINPEQENAKGGSK